MSWQEKIKLSSNEKLVCSPMRTKGHVGQTEITRFTIVDDKGQVIGQGDYTEHTNIRGLSTECILHYTLNGQKICEEW
jgi:hypothetical protein